MTKELIDTLRSGAKVVPGGEIVLEVILKAALGSVQGATRAADELAKVGKRLGGTPVEIPAALVGAGLGAVGGFMLGPVLGASLAQSLDFDPGSVAAARTVEMEEVFSLYLEGRGAFGESPQYTPIQMNLYDLGGRWVGFLTGLQLNQTPQQQLFQAPSSPDGMIDQPPVPPVPVTEWTNGCYVFADGSTIITEGMARSYFVPQKDGSLLFMVTNAHVITRGTGVYEGVRGIKQGIGAVFVPAGEFPSKFFIPGFEFSVNTVDTFRFIKKSFQATPDPFSRKPSQEPTSTRPRPASVNSESPASDGREQRLSGSPSAVIARLREIVSAVGVSAARLPLPDLPGADTRAYETADLFRRYAIGEGEISQDRKHLSFKGRFYSTDGQRDGHCQGIYEFLVPLSSVGETPEPATLPFNLETLSINQIQPQAFCKERWEFAGGDSLTMVGSALLHKAQLLTGETQFWISSCQLVTVGEGSLSGAAGVKTTGLSILLPPGESLQSATRVAVKTLDLFVVLRQDFIGKRQAAELSFNSSSLSRPTEAKLTWNKFGGNTPMKRFVGKVALVTGSTSGIGRATALAFAREGAKVVVCGRRLEQGNRTVELIQKEGAEAIFVRTDVTNAADVEAVVNKTLKTFGRLDYAVNNAGTEGTIAPISNLTEEQWELTVNTNLRGVWVSLKYEIPAILKQGGAIVNTASVAGLVGIPLASIYCATKGGIIALTRAVALEYANKGIRINSISPGTIETALTDRVVKQLANIRGVSIDRVKQEIAAGHPLGRFGAPEEVAEAIIWLASDAASYVTGCNLIVDAGYTAQ